ncbi:MAG: hypothetical protein RSF90_04725 [Pygmaiobacter sp.]
MKKQKKTENGALWGAEKALDCRNPHGAICTVRIYSEVNSPKEFTFLAGLLALPDMRVTS